MKLIKDIGYIILGIVFVVWKLTKIMFIMVGDIWAGFRDMGRDFTQKTGKDKK